MKRFLFPFIFTAIIFLFLPVATHAAVLSIQPSGGTFTVGSTFNISVFLDTQGASVNALEMSLGFPPDKLQLVSPATSKSIISVWTSQPRFNNQTGEVDFQGGMPGGINVSSGLVSTLTFRVKSVGEGVVKFLDNSKVLLNDGLGTDALRQTTNAFYDFVLPPPAGPLVISRTDPDQSTWYNSPLVTFDWAPSSPDIQGYSYVLNDNPVDVPDDISEGLQTRVAYQNVSDGTHYFHIKSLRAGVWGGVSDFAVNIDTTPPAEFPITIIPDARTSNTQPIIQFFTTDANSGLDHYEVKIVALSPSAGNPNSDNSGNQNLFVEATSPYLPPVLGIGDYDVIVRAYDKAGNYREETQRLEIRQSLFQPLGNSGLRIAGVLTVPWAWFWLFGAIVLGLLIWLALILRRWHLAHDLKIASRELPSNIQAQLEELNRLRSKYGKNLIILLMIGMSVFLSGHMIAQAQIVSLSPPYINEVSKNISNEDIFYVGGKTDTGGSTVIIYLQNLQTGETVNASVVSDKLGNWFYRSPSFLSVGNYLIWTQNQVDGQLSPPSPQVQLGVTATAIQFGSSRFSYEIIYLILMIVFLLGLLILGSYVIYHGRRAYHRKQAFEKEIKNAEESIRRGFAVLRRDIQGELRLVNAAKLSQSFSDEEKVKEEQLLKDLEWVEKYIGQEIWEIERKEEKN